jgi:hypothetical protein
VTTRTAPRKGKPDKRGRAKTKIKRHKVRRKILGWLFSVARDIKSEARKGRDSRSTGSTSSSSQPAPKRVKFGSKSTSGGLKGGGSGGQVQHHRPDEDWLGAENRRSGDWGGRNPFEPTPKRSESPVGRATGQGFSDETPPDWQADPNDLDNEGDPWPTESSEHNAFNGLGLDGGEQA